MSESKEDDCVRLDTRLAGQLKRYHTWPIIGQQTIGEHCWQILRIYLAVVDTIDPHMICHIMYHDAGEHFTGDLPYPIKRDNPILKEELDRLQNQSIAAQMQYWGCFRQIVLSDYDKAFFKQMELIEMAEFGMDQVNLGNNHGFIIADRCLHAAYEQKPCYRLCKYVIKRIKLYKIQNDLSFEHDIGKNWWRTNKWEAINDSESEASGRNTLQS
jgi:5'-deoxynucleotidase YfbR-like HD superfamily hydrolase